MNQLSVVEVVVPPVVVPPVVLPPVVVLPVVLAEFGVAGAAATVKVIVPIPAPPTVHASYQDPIDELSMVPLAV